jgi:hypothetical protein
MRPKHTARDQKSKTAPANAEGGNRKAALNRSRQKFAGTTDFINGIDPKPSYRSSRRFVRSGVAKRKWSEERHKFKFCPETKKPSPPS